MNDKRLKEKGKKSNTDYFSLPYGHTTSPITQPSSKCQHDKGIMDLFCRSTLLKNQVSFISRLKDERVSDIAAGKFKFDFIWTWTVHLTRDILLASLFLFL